MPGFTGQTLGESKLRVNPYRQALMGEDVQPTTGEVVGAYVQEAFTGTGTAVAIGRSIAKEGGNPISQEDYKKSPYQRSNIKWRDGMTDVEAKILAENDDETGKRGFIISRANTTQDVLGFTAALGAGTIEPVNASIGLATMGIGAVGMSAIRATQVAKMYQNLSKYRKLAVAGTIEGLAGAAAADPLMRYTAKQLQQDYTTADSIFNFATSALFSVGARTVPAFVTGKVTARKKMEMLDDLDVAAKQIMTGQEVDVTAANIIRQGDIAKKPIAEQIKILGDAGIRVAEPLVTTDGISIKSTAELNEYIAKEVGVETALVDKGEDLYLSAIKTPEDIRGAGLGTEAMQKITQYADLQGKRITLTPTSDFGGDVPRLMEFYKKAGFVENVGENKRPEISDTMYREPQQAIEAGSEAYNNKLAEINKASTENLKASVNKANDPNNSTAYDTESIRAIDDAAKVEFSEQEELSFYEEEISAMREQGLLSDEDIDALEYLNNLDPEDIVRGYEAAYLCLTKG